MSFSLNVDNININNSVVNIACQQGANGQHDTKPVVPNFAGASPSVDLGSTDVSGNSYAGTVSFVVTLPGVLHLEVKFGTALPNTPTVLLSSLTTATTVRGLYATDVTNTGFTVHSTTSLISAGSPVYTFSFIAQ